MELALELWPVCFWGFWAYPFIAIPYFRRRRFIRELAAIGSSRKADDLTTEQALLIVRACREVGTIAMTAPAHPGPAAPSATVEG